MIVEQTKFLRNGLQLAATIVMPRDKPAKTGVMRVGGGANLPHWPNRWQETLASSDIASISFDYAGVGDSQGELHETSLLTRLADACRAYEIFRDVADVASSTTYIMGVSMGAPLTIQLGIEYQCEGIILASPAAYSRHAWDKTFGDAFREIVRKGESWRDSVEFDSLRTFPGKILLAYGLQDTVVPAPILEAYSDIVEGKDGTKLVLDATHAFLREQNNETAAQKEFWGSVVEFVSG